MMVSHPHDRELPSGLADHSSQCSRNEQLSETTAVLKLEFVNCVPVSSARRYDYPHQSCEDPVTGAS